MATERPLIGIQVHGDDPAEVSGLQPDLCIEIALAPAWWGVAEPRLGDRTWSQVDWWAEYAAVGGTTAPDLVWTLYVVHMNRRGALPLELQDVPMDAPEFAERFDAYIAALADRGGWSHGRPIVVLGNEVDLCNDENPDDVAQFLRFMPEAHRSIRRHAPGARLVNSVTFDSTRRSEGRELCDAVNADTDVVAFTFYDWSEDRKVRLSDLGEVIAEMREVAGPKPLLLKEIGLATGPALGSSEELQARRVHELFDVLEGYTRDEVEGAVWLGLDDWDRDEMRRFIVDQFPSLVGDEGFFQFLTTLGLRSDRGKPKHGYDAWRERAGPYTASRKR